MIACTRMEKQLGDTSISESAGHSLLSAAFQQHAESRPPTIDISQSAHIVIADDERENSPETCAHTVLNQGEKSEGSVELIEKKDSSDATEGQQRRKHVVIEVYRNLTDDSAESSMAGAEAAPLETRLQNWNIDEKPDGSDVSTATSLEEAVKAANSDYDPMGEDNPGRRIMIKMGWKAGRGLGLKGTGIRRPIKLEREVAVYTRETRAGLAHASEINPFKNKPVPVSQLMSWEIVEKTADWKKGSKSSHWVAGGILGGPDSLAEVGQDKTPQESLSPAFYRYVDGWDDKSYSEVRQVRRVSLESEVDSPSRTWEDVWADGVNQTLDQLSLNTEHFFACCQVLGPLVRMLHIEPTGEIFQSKVWAATARDLRRVLEERLEGRLRVLRPLHFRAVGGDERDLLSVYAVTQKASGEDEGLLNKEASRSQGCKIFGSVYLVCRGSGREVRDYLLTDYMRDLSPA